jgi:hypothetical protein
MWIDFWNWLAKLPSGSASFVGTLTGSTFGLIAILIGALVNAHLNRKRDDAARDADRIAVASALYAELQGIHRAFTENAVHLEKHLPNPIEGGGFTVPEPSVKILPEMLSKIGLLNAETIRKVMNAYVLTEQYLDGLILLGGVLQANMPENRQMVYMDAHYAATVAKMNNVKAGVVKEAMEALAPYLK